jgi:hypothetical protein
MNPYQKVDGAFGEDIIDNFLAVNIFNNVFIVSKKG